MKHENGSYRVAARSGQSSFLQTLTLLDMELAVGRHQEPDYFDPSLRVLQKRGQERCACILVANPAIFEPECRTVEQMRLANALCRFKEMAG